MRSLKAALASACLLTMAMVGVSLAQDEEPLSVLRRPRETIDNLADFGDLVEISFPASSFSGPAMLKIEASTKGVFGKPIVVLKVPVPQKPGEPEGPDHHAEVRAYAQAVGKGDTTLVVTPSTRPGEPKIKPRVYRFKAAKRGAYVQKADL